MWTLAHAIMLYANGWLTSGMEARTWAVSETMTPKKTVSDLLTCWLRQTEL